MTYAPIVVFGFNRLESLKVTINSLLKNKESTYSDLYIYVDGARDGVKDEIAKVKAVQDYVKTISGFKSINYTFATKNKGLGPSIISGVNDVITRFGRVIVVEDDLVFSENFLSYMNTALDKYIDKKEVFSVCGFGSLVKKPLDYKYEYYLCVRSSSWGWGTWKDRWESVDWQLKDWDTVRKNRWKFNRWGGSDCYGMLKGWKAGRNKSWAIRFVYAQFVQGKLSLFPFISMVDNYGFDGEGTNCPNYCRTKWLFENQTNKYFSFPESISMNSKIYKDVMSYRSIYTRIKAKLINIFLNIYYKVNKHK